MTFSMQVMMSLRVFRVNSERTNQEVAKGRNHENTSNSFYATTVYLVYLIKNKKLDNLYI